MPKSRRRCTFISSVDIIVTGIEFSSKSQFFNSWTLMSFLIPLRLIWTDLLREVNMTFLLYTRFFQWKLMIQYYITNVYFIKMSKLHMQTTGFWWKSIKVRNISKGGGGGGGQKKRGKIDTWRLLKSVRLQLVFCLRKAKVCDIRQILEFSGPSK